MKLTASIVIVMLHAVSQISFAQALPSKIRGYKVYEANVAVLGSARSADEKGGKDAQVTLGEPEIVDIGISGITLEIGADIAAMDQGGRIDFLSFSDFRINGLAVDIEEYRHEFSFKKGEAISIPNPARLTIGTLTMARTARRELIESKTEWLVTGTVFVFGKFKKFGIGFKRVVPVKIDLKINNPLNPKIKHRI